MSLMRWLTQVQDEGHDSLGAFELPIGAASFLGLALGAMAPKSWLPRLVLLVGIALALYWGHLVEHRRLYALGQRRFRGTLHLRLTWLVIGWSLALSSALRILAHLRTWDQSAGWYDTPIFLNATLSLIFLALGVKVGVRRWIGLGLALALATGVLPWIAMQGVSAHLAAAFWIGGALWISAYLGQVEFEHRYHESKMI